MSDAAAVLLKARGQINYHEIGNNRNKFSTYWGAPAEPWCADFACWALRATGALDVPYSASTIQLYGNFRQAGRVGSAPRVGALAFFRWPGHNAFCQHVGIVESLRSDGRIVCIEGNTSLASAGSQWNGGGVYRKVRSRSLVVGYGYPKYATAPAPRRPSSTFGTSPVLRLGSKGQAVLNVQHGLNRLGNHLKEDGDFGPAMLAVVKTFQSHRHLAVDGVFGPVCWAALRKAIH